MKQSSGFSLLKSSKEENPLSGTKRMRIERKVQAQLRSIDRNRYIMEQRVKQ